MRSNGAGRALIAWAKGLCCLAGGLLCAALAFFVLARLQARGAGEAARIAAERGLLPMLRGDGGSVYPALLEALPLVMLAFSAALAWQGGLYNLGGAGQYALGAAAALAGAGQGLPWYGCLMAAGLAGTLPAALSARLKTRFGVHEALTTALGGCMSLYAAQALLEAVPVRAGSAGAEAGVLAAGGALIAVLLISFYGTAWGRDARIMGDSPALARYVGRKTDRLTRTLLALAGLVCGAAGGLAALLGVQEAPGLSLSLSGVGLQSLAAAALSGGSPIGTLLFGPAVAWLVRGARHLDTSLFPRETGEMALALGLYLAAFLALPRRKGGAAQ